MSYTCVYSSYNEEPYYSDIQLDSTEVTLYSTSNVTIAIQYMPCVLLLFCDFTTEPELHMYMYINIITNQ